MKKFDVRKLPSDQPFLLLEWKKSRRKGFDHTCFYHLYIPVDKLDIRAQKAFGGYFCRVKISKTFSSGGTDHIHCGEIDTPYRDGAHAVLDSNRLGFPAYVKVGDKIQRIVFDENEVR
jgi:hypothetical protein